MKKDIECREDIEKLITQFYSKVRADEKISFLFKDINWQHHIPVIVDFWETILLDNPIYKKNAMEVHYDVNKKTPLIKDYFESWIALFLLSVDELFEGKNATLAKTRAKSIADVMFFKMSTSHAN
ncbi:MAG: group III truncated hemoglobin [Chitinophagaceae bacterium]|nr:group III truncated hemoglobin [Chitinophagaceae bacterium]